MNNRINNTMVTLIFEATIIIRSAPKNTFAPKAKSQACINSNSAVPMHCPKCGFAQNNPPLVDCCSTAAAAKEGCI